MELLAGRQVSQSVNVLCVCVWCGGVGVWVYVATVRWGNLEGNFIANSEWALLEALCVVLFEGILVSL